MNVRFDNKVVVVTGAGSGIGYTCAKMVAESGAVVAMIGRNPEKIQKAAELLKDAGNVTAYACDITDREGVIATVEKIRAELGEIDVLMNCAGQGWHDEDSYVNWDKGLELNATGTYQVMKEVAERCMLPRKTGSIVNIASMAGVRGMMNPLGEFGYSAGKAAITGLTRQGAVMWGAQGVRVNAVAPGGVCSGGVGISNGMVLVPDDPNNFFSDIIPTHRLSTTEEIAGMVLFLASDFSSNTTGQVIIIDGGVSQIGC